MLGDINTLPFVAFVPGTNHNKAVEFINVTDILIIDKIVFLKIMHIFIKHIPLFIIYSYCYHNDI